MSGMMRSRLRLVWLVIVVSSFLWDTVFHRIAHEQVVRGEDQIYAKRAMRDIIWQYPAGGMAEWLKAAVC
jgi:hypothetical protein